MHARILDELFELQAMASPSFAAGATVEEIGE